MQNLFLSESEMPFIFLTFAEYYTITTTVNVKLVDYMTHQSTFILLESISNSYFHGDVTITCLMYPYITS